LRDLKRRRSFTKKRGRKEMKRLVVFFVVVLLGFGSLVQAAFTGAIPEAGINYVGSKFVSSCVECTSINVGLMLYHNADSTGYPIEFSASLPLYLESQGLRMTGVPKKTICVTNENWSNSNDGKSLLVTGEISCDAKMFFDAVWLTYEPLRYGEWEASYNYEDNAGVPYVFTKTIVVKEAFFVFLPLLAK
jgi:hypothetical protein